MIDLNSMLGNVSGFSIERIDEMASGLEKLIAANKDLTPDGIQRVKHLQEALSQLYQVRLEKNPASEIKAATEALKRAKKELEDAEQSKVQADASRMVDYKGSSMTIGDAYRQAMLEGATQEMAQYYEMVVKVGDAEMKYGDVLKMLTMAEDKFGQTRERSLSAQEKQYKQFQKLIGTYSKASKAISSMGALFAELGNSRLGKVLDTMSEIGDIAISVVSDVKGAMQEATKSISDVATSASEGMKGTAAGAAAAMAAAEKASVILTIISAALQVVTKIIHLAKDMRNDAIDKQIKRQERRIGELGDEYEDLGDAVNKAFSKEAAKAIDQQNKNLEEQNRILEEQMRLEAQKKQDDEDMQDALKTYQDKIRENNKLIKENGEAMVEAIMGEDVKDAIDRFADAVSDSWTGEGSIKESARKAVKTMVKNMVTESMKQDLSEPVRQLQERMMAMYNSKGIMTQQDMARFKSEAEQLAKRMESKYGFMDDMLKDMDATFAGTSGSFQTMSQESADELNGRFAQAQQAVQGTFEAMLHVADELGMANNALNAINNAFSNLEESVALANGYLFSIDANVAKMAKEVIPSLQTIETIVKRDR